MKTNKIFTFSVYTESNLGLLNRISSIFLKRHINIESLTASQSEIKDVSRFVIVAEMTEVLAKKIVNYLEKQIEVIKAFVHTDDETIYQESALYKMKPDSLFDELRVQKIIKKSHANIVTVTRDFFVIEKTGHRGETEKLYNKLAPYGLLQFVRSARIAVSKETMPVSDILL